MVCRFGKNFTLLQPLSLSQAYIYPCYKYSSHRSAICIKYFSLDKIKTKVFCLISSHYLADLIHLSFHTNILYFLIFILDIALQNSRIILFLSEKNTTLVRLIFLTLSLSNPSMQSLLDIFHHSILHIMYKIGQI